MPARADTRVALIIGNSTYQNVPLLPNPVNDANDFAAALSRLGFSVKTLVDVNYDDMRHALIQFGQQARGADLAIVFFAGHGVQMGGENWLVPVDAQLATDINVANEAIGLQSLVRAVSNTTKLGLVILDACRSNPFLPKMQNTNVQRAVERGFSRVEPSDNVLVAYSARDGTTARDGSGRNSPFTQSLLSNIETPGIEVRFLFATARDEVMAATHREQQPFMYGSLSKEKIYLSSRPLNPDDIDAQEKAAAQAWDFVKDSKTPDILQAFIDRYFGTFYADLARARMNELRSSVVTAPVAPEPPTLALPSISLGSKPMQTQMDKQQPPNGNEEHKRKKIASTGNKTTDCWNRAGWRAGQSNAEFQAVSIRAQQCMDKIKY
jgi:hypothetical protein